MLATLDVLIGFSVVMLVFSMPVTLLGQAVTTGLNLRGAALQQGVARLLGLLDSKLEPHANKLAHDMLTHPLVATRGLLLEKRVASVVLREEMARLILHFGKDGKLNGTDQLGILRTVLQTLGIPNPDETLGKVRNAQLALEMAHPEMAADARATAALLDQASSDFLAKFNAWFDQTMDRVSQVFTLYSRVVTFLIATAVALAMQVDSIALINRLATDPATRDALVKSAIEHPERYSPATDEATIKAAAADVATADKALADARAMAEAADIADKPAALLARADAQDARDAFASRLDRLQLAATAAAARTAAAAAEAELARLTTQGAAATEIAAQTALTVGKRGEAEAAGAAELRTLADKLRNDPGLAELTRLDLVEIPQSGAQWQQNLWPRLPGILITAALLSLGGSFWYALLGNMLKLRPLLAKKDEEQRSLRQTTQLT